MQKDFTFQRSRYDLDDDDSGYDRFKRSKTSNDFILTQFDWLYRIKKGKKYKKKISLPYWNADKYPKKTLLFGKNQKL